MSIVVESSLVARARQGELDALDALLRTIEGPVYNLAVRQLGNRDDARDATQEILLKITTHLATWRGEGAFGTWVYGIAGNHLLNLAVRQPRTKEMGFFELEHALDQGEAYAASVNFDAAMMSADERLDARRTALSCTQAMLLCLDPPGRLAYVLDVIFGLESPDAAAIQGISAAAHRQRLSRAKQALHAFMERRCGLVNDRASCRCARQVPGKRAAAAAGHFAVSLKIDDAELEKAAQGLRELTSLGDAAAVLRGAPSYGSPVSMLEEVRRILATSSILTSP